jgi:hypothetical protein
MKFKVGDILKRKDGGGFDNGSSDFITIIKISDEAQCLPYLVKYENGFENSFDEEFLQKYFDAISEEEYVIYKMAR